MRKTKYLSFSVEIREQLEQINQTNFILKDTVIKSPNNPAQLIPAKVIIYKVSYELSDSKIVENFLN